MKGGFGETPPHYEINPLRKKIVNAFLKNRVLISWQDSLGRTLPHYAVLSQNLEIIANVLIENKADVNISGGYRHISLF